LRRIDFVEARELWNVCFEMRFQRLTLKRVASFLNAFYPVLVIVLVVTAVVGRALYLVLVETAAVIASGFASSVQS